MDLEASILTPELEDVGLIHFYQLVYAFRIQSNLSSIGHPRETKKVATVDSRPF